MLMLSFFQSRTLHHYMKMIDILLLGFFIDFYLNKYIFFADEMFKRI